MLPCIIRQHTNRPKYGPITKKDDANYDAWMTLHITWQHTNQQKYKRCDATCNKMIHIMTHVPRIFSIVHQPTKDVTNYGAWCLASFVQTHKRMMQIMTHFALHHSTAHQHTNVHTSTNANAHTHTTLSNEHLAECPQLGFWRAEFAIGVLCVFPVHTWVASKIWDVNMKTH